MCGKPGANTKDHIPPRGIFPKYPVGQLITVPAHTICNNQFSEDDALLRDFVIAASWRAPEGLRAWDNQVVSSWQKNRRAKLALLKRLKKVWVKDPLSGGAVLRDAIFAEVSLFERQVKRWMKGLYYKRFGQPLPDEVIIEVQKLQPPEISLPPLNEQMAQNGKRPNWIHIEPNVFSYFYGAAEEDGRIGFAIFVFFNTEVYMAHSNVVG